MTEEKQEVLAKSEPPKSLKQHVDECLCVYESLKVAFERIPVSNIEHFWNIVRLGIIFHDLGKSHSEFQKMLIGEKSNWYHQRHELFSTSAIDFLKLSEDDLLVLKLIVAGHHKDFDVLFKYIQDSYKTGEDILSFGEDGKLDWEEESKKLNLQFICRFLNEYDIPIKIETLRLPVQLVKNYTNNPSNSSDAITNIILLAAGALKQCDHAASAGIFKVNILQNSHFNFLYDTKWAPYFHQKKASEVIGNIVITAPTGSGKTETSLMWLHKQLKENGQGRSFYILPFTASINAMFERLNEKMQGNNEIVGLLHGKLSEYIESRFGDEVYSSQNESLKRELKESFRALVPPLKVATPFQLLKSIFGLKGFEKGIFEMSGGYFIFDEIHVYDPEVSAQIKVLIEFASKILNVKICLMTATLPTFLKKELTNSIGEFTEVHANKELYKSFIRHRVQVAGGLLSEHTEDIQQRLNMGDKVLVVCNSVNQAQHIYNCLEASEKVLLHGAFNGIDRNRKEANLKSENVKLLVGTQAIEVSLDVDYDVIFTEPAPLDALLQRFGRVNRHRINGQYRPPCDCIVYSERNPIDKFIYKNEDTIAETITVLQDIENNNSGIVDENTLQKYIDQVYPCWNPKDKELFDRIYSHLKTDVWENLSPFIYHSHREEEFEKQFDGVKVLPAVLVEDYEKYLDENRFITAESLKVSISKHRLMSLKQNSGVELYKTAYKLKGMNSLKELPYYVINRKYDSELGLQIDVEEISYGSFFI